MLELSFSLRAGARDGQYVAAVREVPPDVAQFDRLAFRASASRPLRLSVQLRDAAGRRWQRSVYVEAVAGMIVVPFADMRLVGGISTQPPDLQTVHSILFVVDLTNARPGTAGEIRLSDMRLAR